MQTRHLFGWQPLCRFRGSLATAAPKEHWLISPLFISEKLSIAPMARQIRTGTTRKVSHELFTMTYGAFVAQLAKDLDNAEEVNKQLDKIGYAIGLRLAEDYIAQQNAPNPSSGSAMQQSSLFPTAGAALTVRCADLREVSEVLSKVAFKHYLGAQPSVANWSVAADEFSLIFDANPLGEFVELPSHLATLSYAAILCGAIRGALEMLQIEVQCWFVQDTLRGDHTTELRVKFIRRIEEALPVGES